MRGLPARGYASGVRSLGEKQGENDAQECRRGDDEETRGYRAGEGVLDEILYLRCGRSEA